MERAAFLIEESQQRPAGARLSCLLNPNTLVFRRVAGLRPRRSLAGALTQDGLRDDPLIQTGGGYTELRLDLLFDVNLPGTWLGNLSASPGAPDSASEPDRDVRDLTRPLWELSENQRRPGATAGPPRVLFVWGKKVWDFPAVVAAVAERLENFTAGGIPQRSFLRLRLLRADDGAVPEELPSPALLTVATDPVPEPEPPSPLDVLPLAEQPPPETYESYVSPGHPLFLTAFQFFGDASMWDILADANPDVDPVFVPPGTVLRIPTSARSGVP
jgi:hypothetical protein